MKNKSKIIVALLLSLSLICSQMMPIMAEEGEFSDNGQSEEVVLDLASEDMQDQTIQEEPKTVEEIELSEVEQEEENTEDTEQGVIEQPDISNATEISENTKVLTDAQYNKKEEQQETEKTAESEAVIKGNASEEKIEAKEIADEPEKVTEPIKAISDDSNNGSENKTEKNTGKNPVNTYKVPNAMRLAAMQPKAVNPAIADGRYVPDAWSIRMASGRPLKNQIDCTYVKVSGDKVYAQIVFHSAGFPKLTSNEIEYKSVIDEVAETSTFFIPVEINKDYSILAFSTKMNTTIQYVMNATVKNTSSAYTGETPMEVEEPDENAIADGRYIPDACTIGMASGRPLKNPIECIYVKISGSKTYAQIVYHSAGFPKLTSNGVEYESVIDVEADTSTFFIPVEINKDYSILAFSTKMNTTIEYVMNITLTKDSVKYDGTLTDEPAESDDNGDNPGTNDPNKPGQPTDPTNPTDPTKPTNPTDPTKPTKPVIPSKPEKLADGTYKLKADTDNRMFYLVPKDDPDAYRATLVKKEGKYTVTITLSGTGYDYLFVGSAKKAEQTPKKEWIKHKESNGYYSYTFEIPKLDKEFKIASHSEKYDKWYEHTIIFYSDGAKLVKAGSTTVPKKPKKDQNKDKNKNNKNKNKNNKDNTSGTQTEFKNDHKKDKESESKGDTEKSTYAVDSSTGLADGVYTPDKFSWSGGSGRLAYIRCDKITVTDGQAYATIVFSSPSYDQLKANGRVYYNSGSEFSTFVIPVELNTNNSIVGRTTAMSAPHWIEYSIFIYSNEAAKAKGEKEISGDSIKTSKLAEEAPEIAGLEAKEETEVHHAENFKIFNYEDGVALIQMDLTNDSGLKYKKEDKNAEDKVEYDDEGKPIAKSQGEITEEMYHANVVNYLIVPKGVEVPAGLDKECIIIQAPLKKAQISSKEAMEVLCELGVSKYIKATGIDVKDIKNKDIKTQFEKEKTFYAGDFAKPDYKEIIRNKIDINILPSDAVPAKVNKKDKNGKKLSDEKIKEQKKAAKEQKKTLELIEKRYSTLGIPVVIDRSASEKDEIAKAEWILVYGTMFGCEEEAQKLFAEYEKKYKEENHE